MHAVNCDSLGNAFFMVPPPLLGDAEGKYRVHIVGNSGTGKSTSGERLANLLGVPFISLDTYFYKSGWEESTTEEMRANVAEAFANAPNGWVADGNYTRRLGSIIEAAESAEARGREDAENWHRRRHGCCGAEDAQAWRLGRRVGEVVCGCGKDGSEQVARDSCWPH
ncbi:hypothetical protein FB45DRAFT_929376, partial [Roridomyces roridus]